MAPVTHFLDRIPYWLLAFILLCIVFVWVIVNNADYNTIFRAIVKGVTTTVYVSVIAYVAALAVGLVTGLMRLSGSRVVREVASFYVEIVRGVPMLVILYYIAFVGAPVLILGINGVGRALIEGGVLTGVGTALTGLTVRHVDFTARAILALTIGYGAFVSEIFRAGIQSISVGQMEAARSLGMSYWQAMRYVILPQAVRNVLPPLGNDFIAMLKDSSLVSVLGVQDITQLGKIYAASTFRFFETYNVVGFLYLLMTIGLALLVRGIEKRMGKHS
ncbi:MAG: amino acid ABC transporter permease [Ardenticatenia bacterium]|nr:amino acid ABC transporter permease [Ardenticatenia bacterium]